MNATGYNERGPSRTHQTTVSATHFTVWPSELGTHTADPTAGQNVTIARICEVVALVRIFRIKTTRSDQLCRASAQKSDTHSLRHLERVLERRCQIQKACALGRSVCDHYPVHAHDHRVRLAKDSRSILHPGSSRLSNQRAVAHDDLKTTHDKQPFVPC